MHRKPKLCVLVFLFCAWAAPNLVYAQGDRTDLPDSPSASARAKHGNEVEREVSWKSLPKDFLQDQKNIWLAKETLPQAEHAAQQALQLDDRLAEAHVSMGAIKILQFDRAYAEQELKRAIDLAPGYPYGHYFYALQYLSVDSRFREAEMEMRRALNLDPLSVIMNINLCQIYIYARRYDDALAQCRKTMELDNQFGRGHSVLGVAYQSKGMYPQAIAEFRRNLELVPSDALAQARLGAAYALNGQTADAKEIQSQLEQLAKARFVPPAELAALYLALGQKPQALASLEAAYELHDGWLLGVNVDPRFDSLRGDAQFQSMVRRVGFDPARSPGIHP